MGNRVLQIRIRFFTHYQKPIQLRHEMPIITDGVYELLDKENESVYAYLRKGEKETLLVVGNSLRIRRSIII